MNLAVPAFLAAGAAHGWYAGRPYGIAPRALAALAGAALGLPALGVTLAVTAGLAYLADRLRGGPGVR